jgi:transcriptional regulator with GAF, ATPase, and Fis domain
VITTAAVFVWALFAYFWFHSAVEKSVTRVVSKAENEIIVSDAISSRSSTEKLRPLFDDLEQSKEIVAYSVVDKGKNAADGVIKRDIVLRWLNVIYPIKAGSTIVGWVKVWPSPEIVASLLFEGKNVLVLLISFLFSLLIVFCLMAAYVILKFLVPLSEYRKYIKDISNGKDIERSVETKNRSGFWKNMYEAAQKMNLKVLDSNTAVQMLFSASKTLTSQVDLNNIFNTVINVIQKKIPEAMCAIVLPAEGGSLRIAAKRGYSSNFLKSIRLEEGNPVADAFMTSKMTMIKNMGMIEERFGGGFVSEGVLTQINIPLIGEDNSSLGVLNVSAKTDAIFNVDVSETINITGKYLSIALRNAKMYDKVHALNRKLETEVNITSNELIQTNARLIRKVRDLKALSDISAFASARFNLGEVTCFVAQKIMELTGMETSAILTEDPFTKQFSFLDGSFSLSPEQLSAVKFSPENSEIIRDIKKSRKVSVFSNIDEIKSKVPEFAAVISMSSAIFVPIENNGEVVGVIVSINKFGYEISDNDITIIQHIAVLFDGIIEKVKLYSELESKVSRLIFLQRISSAVATTPDLKKVLEKIIDVTKDAFRADLCAVLLYDEKTKKLVTQSGAFFTGGSDKVMLQIAADDEDSLSAKVFREGKAYLSADAMNDPSVKSHSANDWKLKSIIVVPLVSDDKVIGVLRVGNHEANVYNEDDKNLIVMIANQAAILIGNANLYGKITAGRKPRKS